MTFDFKGNPNKTTKIDNLITLLKSVDTNQIWVYEGLDVTIDQTVDHSNENVLIRWLDMDEGFNDKIIIYSLTQFEKLFKPRK